MDSCIPGLDAEVVAQSDFQRRARFNVGKRSALHSVDHASDAYAEGNFVVEVKSVVDVGCNLVRRDVGAVVVLDSFDAVGEKTVYKPLRQLVVVCVVDSGTQRVDIAEVGHIAHLRTDVGYRI